MHTKLAESLASFLTTSPGKYLKAQVALAATHMKATALLTLWVPILLPNLNKVCCRGLLSNLEEFPGWLGGGVVNWEWGREGNKEQLHDISINKND